MLTVDVKLRLYNLWHFAPAIILALMLFIFHLYADENLKLEYFNSVIVNGDFTIVFEKTRVSSMAALFFISRIVFSIQVFVYLLMGLKLVRSYNIRLSNFYSNLSNRQLLWVRMLSILFLFTSFTSTVLNFIGRGFFLMEKELLLIPSLLFSTLLFLMGYHGSIQHYTVKDIQEDEDLDISGIASSSVVGNDTKDLLKDKLVKVIEDEKLYMQADLRITLLCQKLNTNRTYLSSVINDEFGESFNCFINRYRIKYACELISQNKEKNYSLDELAVESGFGSTSSFIRAFKQLEGVTPGKYFKEL